MNAVPSGKADQHGDPLELALGALIKELDARFDSDGRGAHCPVVGGLNVLDLDTQIDLDCSREQFDTSSHSAESPKRPASWKRREDSARKSKRQVVYRSRRKWERLELQCQANELAKVLHSLKEDAHWTKTLKRYVRESGRMHGWKGIAIRQMQRRREAEDMARTLQALVEANDAFVRTILQSIQARQRVVRSCIPPSILALDYSDLDLINRMLSDLGADSTEARMVFKSSKALVNSNSRAHHLTTFRRQCDSDSKREWMERAYTITEPFETSQVVRGLMTALPLAYGTSQMQPAMIVLDEPPSVFALKFMAPICLGGSQIPSTGYVVSRRIDEPDRTVFIWRELVTGTSTDKGQFQLRETGCLEAKPVPGQSGWTVIRNVSRAFAECTSISATTNPGDMLELLALWSAATAESDTMDIARAIETVMLSASNT